MRQPTSRQSQPCAPGAGSSPYPDEPLAERESETRHYERDGHGDRHTHREQIRTPLLSRACVETPELVSPRPRSRRVIPDVTAKKEIPRGWREHELGPRPMDDGHHGHERETDESRKAPIARVA